MDVVAFCKAHKIFCESLNLTGRVLVANEGINGTVASTNIDKLNKYTEMLKQHPLYTLKESDFKRSTGNAEPFPDLFIKPVKEIINTGGVIQVPPTGGGGTHLTPAEFHEKIKAGQNKTSSKETVVLDIRNHTEYMVGHFQGAVDPNLRTFAEFPQYLQSKAEELKDKTVLMYCTGGIRCEKASYHLKKMGVEDVYQLQGGVHKYLETYPEGGEWSGKNFVFDKRVFQPVPHLALEKQIVGECYHCLKKFDKLDGEAVCTVCRDMVLVCHECRPVLQHQYHCNRHIHLASCYYTDLSRFNLKQLQDQHVQLQSMLTDMEKVEKNKLKKTKNQRRTMRKQLEKLNTEMRKRSDRGSSGIDSGSNDSSGSSSSSSGSSSSSSESKCRTCGKHRSECPGECWGIWKKRNVYATEQTGAC